MTALVARELGDRLVFYVAFPATADTVCAVKEIMKTINMEIPKDHRFHVSLAGIKPKGKQSLNEYATFRKTYKISEDRKKIVLKDA